MKRRLCLKITVILGNSKSHYCSRQEKKYIYEKESIVFKKKAREGKERRKVERAEKTFIHIWTAGTFHMFRGLNVASLFVEPE